MGFFGYILLLTAGEATFIFIALLMALLVFKAGLHILEIHCHRNGFKELLDNLYREFMMMGLISFGVFISNEGYDYANSSVYISFHFAHMLILFIGLTFILQALLLTGLVASRKGTLLRFSLISSSQLLDEYHALMSSNSMQSLLFRNGPLSISFPELREKIENRILKDFFIRSFNLPEEFNFAMYTCRALKSYVISLSEVRPFNWLILAVFAAINYGKIIIVDDKLKTVHCFVFSRVEASSSGYASTSSYSNDYLKSDFSSSEYTENNSRLLASKKSYSEADLCREYFLSYSVFCAFMLTLFLTSLLIVSEVYMRRLLDKVLEMEIDLEWQDVEEFEEEEALEYLAAEYELQQLELNKSVKNGTPVEETSAKDGVILVPMITSSQEEVDKTTAIPSNVPVLTPQHEQQEQHVPPGILDPDSIPLIPHRDPDPLVFSLQDPASMKPPQPPTGHLALPTPVDFSSNDDIPAPTIRPINPAFKSDHADAYNRRRSATSAPLHEGGIPFRLSKQASGLGPVTERRRAASYSRARSASINFRHPDGVPYPLQRNVSTVGSGAGDGDSRVDCVTPRLPPASVMEEHAQHLKDIGRARSNTFIQYMSNSLPVSLLSSRFLYQKCLERICRAESNRHARNSKMGDNNASFIGSSRNSTNIPMDSQSGKDKLKLMLTTSTSEKEECERNPLQRSPVHEGQAGEAGAGGGGGTGGGSGDASELVTPKPLTSKDSFKLNISPRPSMLGAGGGRQRSFTAENILHRAAFQSQSRSLKTSRENIEIGMNSQPSSTSIDGSSNAQVNGQGYGQAYGQGQDVELGHSSEERVDGEGSRSPSPRRVGSPRAHTPAVHMAGDPIWPTAEPETIGYSNRSEQRSASVTQETSQSSQIYPTNYSVVNRSSVVDKSASGGADGDGDVEEVLDNSNHRRTVSNTHANTSSNAITADTAIIPSEPGIPESGRGVRGRGKRAYSDIFFEMAKPEHIHGSHSLRHTHKRLNGKVVTTTEVIPDPEIKAKFSNLNSQKKPVKPRRSCSELCSLLWTKFISGFKHFLRSLLHGLYEILVFGPSTGHDHGDSHDDGQDDEARIALQKDLSSIFLFGNADLYYRAIELSLLLQCVYIALWCTNFVQVAKDTARAVKWEMFLLIPIPLNFLLLKLVLNFACVLRSAIVLDEEIAVKICEDALDERVVTQRLRKMVRTALTEIEPLKANWTPFLREVFYHYVPDNRPGVSPKQFTLFLHGIQIHISKKSVHRIFKVIDFDQSGFITWTEFSSVVFPELFGPLSGKKSRIDVLNASMQSGLQMNGMGGQTMGGGILDESPVDLSPQQLSQYSAHTDHYAPSHSDHSDVSHSSLSRGPVRQGSNGSGPRDHTERDRFVSFSEPKRDIILLHDYQDRSQSTASYPNDRTDNTNNFNQSAYSEYYDEDGSVLSDGDLDDVYHHNEDVNHSVGEDDDSVSRGHLEKIEECEEENEDD